MPPIKTFPTRLCLECGKPLVRKRYNGRLEDAGVFQRRKFCDQQCMGANFDKRPVTPTPHIETAHYHSRRAIPKGACQNCGEPSGIDVHHIDRNWRNNDPANLIRLCRTCHNLSHDRARRCRICGAKQKGRGLCNRHLMRVRRWGDPTLVKVNQHTPLRVSDD